MTTAFCSKCGTALPANAPEGLCRPCLLEQALASVNENPTQVNFASADETGHQASPELGSFGDFELLEEIARGGMGVVYKARQRSLNRLVAVKLILAGQFAAKQHVQRFRGEATAAAILQHRNIVAVHEVGTHNGQHFFSMDYVEGQNLAQLVGNRPLSPQKAARYVQLIAEAIHYAHEQGILHRDLKPSNVLIDVATDQPRVTDFGLAKRLDGESSITVTGQVLGSPNFMPPEQASASRGKIGRASDVYGLGAILYYTVTARAPFQGATLEATIHEVLNAEPLSPRALNPSVPRDLETICLKCLEKETSRRYQTAQELVEELGRFANDEPIHSRPLSRTERVWRWCRRKPAIAILAASLVLAVVAGFIGVFSEWRRAERHAASEAMQRRLVEESLYSADMLLTQQALDESNVGRAVELLSRYLPTNSAPALQLTTDLRGWEWRYFWRQTRSDALAELGRHAGVVYSVAFSADGSILASGGAGEVIVWDMRTRRQLASLPHPSTYQSVAISSNGLLATASEDNKIRLWDLSQLNEPLEPLIHPENVRALAFSPDGRTLATADEKRVHLWDIDSRRAVAIEISDPWRLAFSPRGEMLAIGRKFAGEIVLWDVIENKKAGSLPSPTYTGRTGSLLFSPDGKFLAAGFMTGGQFVKVWDVASQKEIADLRGHHGWVNPVAFLDGGRTLASGSADQKIKLWETTAWKESTALHGNLNEVWALAAPRDGKILASGSKEGAVKLWDPAAKADEKSSATFPKNTLAHWSLSTDGRCFLAVQTNGTFSIWEIPTLREISPSRPTPLARIDRAVVASSGKLVAFTAMDGTIQLGRPGAFHELHHPRGIVTNLWGVTFSADGGKLAALWEDLTVTVWETTNRQVVSQFEGPAVYGDRISKGGVLAFSPNSELLAVAHGHTRSLLLWNLATGRQQALLSGHAGAIFTCMVASDNEHLATGSGDGTVKLWSVHQPKPIASLGSQTAFFSVAFSADARRIAALSPEGGIKLWDTKTLKQVAQLKTDVPSSQLAFLSDGNTFAAAGEEGFQLWRATPVSELNETNRAK